MSDFIWLLPAAVLTIILIKLIKLIKQSKKLP